MATADHLTVEQLLARASRLDRTDQRRLLDALIQLLQEEQSGRENVPITALRGLGRDIWNEVDAQEYVDRERQAWGG
jgi:hypothetical protein